MHGTRRMVMVGGVLKNKVLVASARHNNFLFLSRVCVCDVRGVQQAFRLSRNSDSPSETLRMSRWRIIIDELCWTKAKSTKTSSACGLSGRSWPCAGFALDCAECAGCVGMRWKAPIVPNCADCAGILPTAWHTANTTLWLSQPGCDLGFAACSFRAVPVVPGLCGSLLAAVPAVLRLFFSFQSER